MSTATLERHVREPESLSSAVARHPVRYGLELAALLLVVGAGIMLLPDLIRYIKIRNM